jgi:hypothetical protein
VVTNVFEILRLACDREKISRFILFDDATHGTPFLGHSFQDMIENAPFPYLVSEVPSEFITLPLFLPNRQMIPPEQQVRLLKSLRSITAGMLTEELIETLQKSLPIVEELVERVEDVQTTTLRKLLAAADRS